MRPDAAQGRIPAGSQGRGQHLALGAVGGLLLLGQAQHEVDDRPAGPGGLAVAESAGQQRLDCTSPLLRVRRMTTTRDGRPVEWSDDRYRSDAVGFSIHNSIGSNPLARRTGPALDDA